MADNVRNILLKLVIDDKEVTTTLNLTNQEVERLKNQAAGVTTGYQNAFKLITTEALKYNQVTNENIKSLTEWMAAQNLSEDEIVQSMAALQQLNNTIDMNSAEYQQNVVAIANIGNAYEMLVKKNQAVASTQRGVSMGSRGMGMAVNQLGYAIGDASMIAVNFRFALMGIGNNLPFIAQGLSDAAREAKALNTTLGKQLLDTLKGGGGLILAINGLMLLMQLLPELFSSATKAAKEHKDKIKELAQEYENLGSTSLDSLKNRNNIMMDVLKKERQEYIRTVEKRDRITGSVVDYTEVITNQKRVDEIDETLKELENKLKAIEQVGTQVKSKVQLILGGRYDISSITKAKEAIGLLNNEFNDAVEGDYKEQIAVKIRALKKYQEELEKGLDSDKTFDTAQKRLEIEQEHNKEMAEIRGASELELLQMEAAHLQERLDLYKKFGEDVTELSYQLQEVQLKINNETLGLTTDNIKEQLDEVDKAMEELADKISTPPEAPKILGNEELDKLRIDSIDSEFERQRALADYEYKLGLKKYEDYENFEEIKYALYAQKSAAIRQIDQAEADHKMQVTQQALSAIGSMFGQHTAAYKAVAVAQTIIETYKAATAALAPPPVGLGPVFGPLLAGVTMAAGMANVAQIEKQDTQMTGFAEGGAVIGENGIEIISPMKEYSEGWGEIIALTNMAAASRIRELTSGGNYPNTDKLYNEVKLFNENLEKYSKRPMFMKVGRNSAKEIVIEGQAGLRKSK